MSQVATKRKLQIRDAKVRAVANFREGGSVLAGTKTGVCEGFTVELSIDSDEPEGTLLALIDQAHRMCFTEHALTSRSPLRTRHRINGQVIQHESANPAEATPGA